VTQDETATIDRVSAVAADMFAAFRPSRTSEPGWLGQELTLGQIHILFVIGREGPLPMGRLAERFGVSIASATGIVARIERRGLVTRIHRTDDRRVVECVLTDAGRRLVDEMSGRRTDFATKALGLLHDDELADYHRLIRVILERSAR
jgi:DNA-binding MarR family transcriptional regulator